MIKENKDGKRYISISKYKSHTHTHTNTHEYIDRIKSFVHRQNSRQTLNQQINGYYTDVNIKNLIVESLF